MGVRLGQAWWPGAVGCVSCTYTVSHDVGPGIAALEIPEQDLRTVRSFGTLVITDGVGTVKLDRCRVTDVSFGASPAGGRTVVLHIADRRWMWRYGAISGNWNQLASKEDLTNLPPGEYIAAGGPYAPGTYRPAHLLMADCLAAMNELTAPLIDPPPAVPVPVEWDDEVPASALAALAAEVGYRVVYQPVANRVLLAPAGAGKPLPDNLPFVSNSTTLDLPERPNTIVLAGGPTVYHDWLALEPVGLEKSGEVRHIDDLSYRPPRGWSQCNAQTMFEASATNQLTAEEARELARRHVWRTFRVKMADVVNSAVDGPNVGGYGRVRDRDQLVLGPVIYYRQKDLLGQPMTEPAEACGKVYIAPADGVTRSELPRAFDHTDRSQVLPWRPTIDGARGLVTFGRQMYEYAGGRKLAPDLFLFTGFTIRSVVGRVPERWMYGGTLAGLVELGCPPEVLRHPELVRIVRTNRQIKDMSPKGTGDNLDDLIPAATYYLNAANARYAPAGAADRTYAGIVPLDPDGAIQQVTWSVGGGQPATTRVSRNSEHAQYLPAFPERRRQEDLRRFLGKSLYDRRARQAPPPARRLRDPGPLPPPFGLA
ncbi:hypothetical protein GobsT_63540 [Gemmata obscuriglobus]|uniref:Uncharacterized protein n=1 Tax=Gemmata obscuriglobus TaxID=114 RepID=A0A2Z3GQ18_9BACT|nr:hypothetical protein [Gemmata obscuriglobus]AWM35913.1 hypothetical protein C1280_02060 [Gemmata obscuriglobus]QEG31532.1 hypothetical protein GobsT_63540 [Gemmata obscuriglobus]VTS10874.1 Uncharacterized protein OS=Planctomyces brasiliensis (strain ATCC 49424 / DSM 5305 / JCM 21570 / NBRC 103401 / IFAM 1448) GN=Plabr_0236 PE=4 SV=1 [Gemmata obscuriglobus UQM 2246]